MNKEIEQMIHQFAEQIYKAGYEDGQKDKPSVFYEQYQKGLDDAWECARKISLPTNKGGSNTSVLNKIFDEPSVYNILKNYSASEAIAKIKQYETEKEKTAVNVEVGDVVYLIDPTHLSIVTALLNDNKVALMSCNGTWWTEHTSFLHKTGKHYDELNAILDELKEEINV